MENEKFARRSFFKIGLTCLTGIIASWISKKNELGANELISNEAELSEPEYIKRGHFRPTQKQLYQWYVAERKSTVKISKMLGVSTSTVGSWLREYGIKIRNNSENQLPLGVTKLTKEELEKLYLEERKSAKQIAEEFGVSSNSVMKYLRRYYVPIRKVS